MHSCTVTLLRARPGAAPVAPAPLRFRSGSAPGPGPGGGAPVGRAWGGASPPGLRASPVGAVVQKSGSPEPLAGGLLSRHGGGGGRAAGGALGRCLGLRRPFPPGEEICDAGGGAAPSGGAAARSGGRGAVLPAQPPPRSPLAGGGGRRCRGSPA